MVRRCACSDVPKNWRSVWKWDADRSFKGDSEISAIYQSEVTKARNKFKEFFNRDSGHRK